MPNTGARDEHHWLDKIIQDQDEYYRKAYGIGPEQRRKLFDSAAEFTEEEEVWHGR